MASADARKILEAFGSIGDTIKQAGRWRELGATREYQTQQLMQNMKEHAAEMKSRMLDRQMQITMQAERIEHEEEQEEANRKQREYNQQMQIDSNEEIARLNRLANQQNIGLTGDQNARVQQMAINAQRARDNNSIGVLKEFPSLQSAPGFSKFGNATGSAEPMSFLDWILADANANASSGQTTVAPSSSTVTSQSASPTATAIAPSSASITSQPASPTITASSSPSVTSQPASSTVTAKTQKINSRSKINPNMLGRPSQFTPISPTAFQPQRQPFGGQSIQWTQNATLGGQFPLQIDNLSPEESKTLQQMLESPKINSRSKINPNLPIRHSNSNLIPPLPGLRIDDVSPEESKMLQLMLKNSQAEQTRRKKLENKASNAATEIRDMRLRRGSRTYLRTQKKPGTYLLN